MAHTPEYVSWNGAKGRCTNPNNKKYADYGGRGITMCDRWLNDFAAFYEDMGPRPGPGYSLGRIDNDGPYSPGNCRWETAEQQRTNRRDVFAPPAQACRHGHEFTPENTRTASDGRRHCRACARASYHRNKNRAKA